MKELILLCLFFQLIASKCNAAKSKYQYVTCSSIVKLFNKRQDVRLHSHDVKYGSGSGLQSVTGTTSRADSNSYWLIKGEHGKECKRGKIIKCGDKIRLQHVNTKKNLHSHNGHRSPMTREQEVCAYGDNGDDGDNWIVKCKTKYWNRKDKIKLKHDVTGRYLHASEETFRRPIAGQHEVCAKIYDGENSSWVAEDGVFVKERKSKK